MSCELRFETELRRRGLRLTHQRKVILSVMHALPELSTADEIHRRAARVSPSIELSTVYRTLDLLQSLGLVAVVDQGDKHHRYKHVGLEPPHFHLVCTRCGKVSAVPLEEGTRFASRIGSSRGFHVDLSQVTLPGLCEDCS